MLTHAATHGHFLLFTSETSIANLVIVFTLTLLSIVCVPTQVSRCDGRLLVD